MMFKKVLLVLLAICLIFSVISCKQNADIGTNAQTPDWLIGKWVSEGTEGLLNFEFNKTNFSRLGTTFSYNTPIINTKVENNKFIIEFIYSDGLVTDTYTFTKDGNKMIFYPGYGFSETYIKA